jgi:hypothetical protein
MQPTNQIMKYLITALLFIAVTGGAVLAASPWDNGPLRVSENGRYLRHENGQPFFWQGDTAWLLINRLDREQAAQYFENRRDKGFNVVQCIFVQYIKHQNAYGDAPYIDGDLTKPATTPGKDPADAAQYDYWDHADYMADLAAKNGIYLALAPAWRDLITIDKALSAENAAAFATHLAERFKHRPNIIWVNGGSARGNTTPEIWQAIGTALKQTAPNHLVTFHPFGRMQSSEWFADAAWLDLHMFSSGHRNYAQDDSAKGYGEDNWRYVLADLSRKPLKPTLDGEPSYENLPQGLHDPMQPYWDAADVRRYAYWSVFAGAAGHVYGENSVRQVHLQGVNKAESGAKHSFFEALDMPGAFHLQHLRRLVLSRPYFERVNDQTVVAGDEGERHDRILVSRGAGYLMAYVPNGRSFQVQMGKISGATVTAWWHDPRTGESRSIGRLPNRGTHRFDPPGQKHKGNDWTLVLDDTSLNFDPPGTFR